MTQMQNRPGGTNPGATQEKAGETLSSESTHLPGGWHEQCEFEGRWHYAEGYADGWAAAEQAIAEEIALAVGVKPYDRRDVIKWLVRTTGQARPPVPYSSTANGTDLTVAERDLFGQLGRVA